MYGMIEESADMVEAHWDSYVHVYVLLIHNEYVQGPSECM